MSTPDAEGSEMVQANAGAVASTEKVIARSEWVPIGTAPKDQSIIVAASNTYQKTWTVGEARWQQDDPDHPYDGDWWWANISPGDYTGDSISNMNGPVEYWQPLPSPPGAEFTIPNDAERDAVSLNQSSSASTVEKLREALALCAGGFEGEGLEIENEWRRTIARNALNGVPLSEYERLEARAALSSIPAPSTPPIGYLYFNPDTGTEFSENHPVKSGEASERGGEK